MLNYFLFILPFLYLAESCIHRRSDYLKESVPVWTNPSDGMEFVYIPAGSLPLLVTKPDQDINVSTWESHEIDGFWMGRTEVTVAQFRSFVRATGYMTTAEAGRNRFNWKNPGFKQSENNPAVYLSISDAQAYTEWAGVELPAESQWLLACRGARDTKYYWGDTINAEYLWYRKNSPAGTKPVATRLPNTYALYDMVGNVWEYVCLENNYFTIRGASWTRCDTYLTRQGTPATDLIANSVEYKISDLQPFTGEPWDNDRGFRCVNNRLTGPF